MCSKHIGLLFYSLSCKSCQDVICDGLGKFQRRLILENQIVETTVINILFREEAVVWGGGGKKIPSILIYCSRNLKKHHMVCLLTSLKHQFCMGILSIWCEFYFWSKNSDNSHCFRKSFFVGYFSPPLLYIKVAGGTKQIWLQSLCFQSSHQSNTQK